MLSGFNTNARHRGVLFHVQTEAFGGGSDPHVVTHLFHGGTILVSMRRGLAHRLASADLQGEVKALMEAQHVEMLERLRRGELDAQIGERLGPEPFAGGEGAEPGAGRTGPAPAAPPSAGLEAATPPSEAAEALAPARDASGRPLDELILDYLVERARRRGARAAR